MPAKINETLAEAMSKIPLDARPAVVEWLKATAANAACTATHHRVLARVSGDSTTRGIALYWASIDRACRLVASRLAASKRAKPRKKR